MAMLHTVNKSSFDRNTFESCLRLAKAGSSVLLIEDGIYAAMKNTTVAEQINAAMSTLNFYILGPDMDARGVKADALIDGFKVVDYSGFVDLSIEHDSVQSWL